MTLEEWAEHVECWASQREENPVAKLQPTTCVTSQICGDKQPMTMMEVARGKAALKGSASSLTGIMNRIQPFLLSLQYFQDDLRFSIC